MSEMENSSRFLSSFSFALLIYVVTMGSVIVVAFICFAAKYIKETLEEFQEKRSHKKYLHDLDIRIKEHFKKKGIH
jgi:hypothetical protein